MEKKVGAKLWYYALLDISGLSLLLYNDNLTTFLAFLTLHLFASIGIAFLVYLGLPSKYKEPKVYVLTFLFLFIFFIPIVSYVGFFLYVTFFKKVVKEEDFKPLYLDFKKLFLIDEVQFVRRMFGEGGVVMYIKNRNLNPELRLKAFLIISENISPQTIKLLKLGLSDTVDEIRLLSFSILSRLEKKLNDEIYKLEQEGVEKNRLKIAKLYWEFIYLNLADEIFQKIIIKRILELLDGLDSKEAKMLYLKIYLLEKNFDKIREILSTMEENEETAPYFMEIAYYDRDFDRIKELMRKYPSIRFVPKFYPIYRLWCENC
jgi:hypothetical protein